MGLFSNFLENSSLDYTHDIVMIVQLYIIHVIDNHDLFCVSLSLGIHVYIVDGNKKSTGLVGRCHHIIINL